MVRRLVYRCGACGGPLRAVEGTLCATQVVNRTCRTCGTRWQLVIKPVRLKNAKGWADLATLVELPGKENQNG